MLPWDLGFEDLDERNSMVKIIRDLCKLTCLVTVQRPSNSRGPLMGDMINKIPQ